MAPCNYIHSKWGYEGDSVTDSCVEDLDAQIEYLGPLKVIMVYSLSVFQ